ncbi:MAG TPA: type III-A CRISPR-associated protein Csm2, partial [Firmicutes bacterium]|nr:type III-A CRISPR-associated protein Csm2 [Bacillota bacterium]
TAQMRRFFHHVRSIDARLKHGVTFDVLRADLDKLHSFAMAAVGQQKVKEPFPDVIWRMIRAVNTEVDFHKGLLPHFEAVLNYFTYYTKG